jgi:3-hydroxyisobutyrate dehydrogenase-like beta-hydroxyacid dehydrogenase
MSRNLATKGKLDKPVILWSRSLDKAHAHSQAVENTVVASTLEAAVKDSDMIWSCLSDHEAVMATFASILENDVKGKLFVECSTVTPEYSNELATKVTGAGAEFVSMPGM